MCMCVVEIELLNEKGLWGGTYHVVLLALISPHVIYFRVHGRNDLLSVRAAELQVLFNSRNDGCWKHVFRSPESRAYRSRNVTLLTYESRVALREALYVAHGSRKP